MQQAQPHRHHKQQKGVTRKDVAKTLWRTTVAGILINLALVVIKGVGGVFSGSQALIADALHSFIDLITDFITFFAVRLGRIDADETHPYGHGKFETFGTLALSVLLTVAALGIGWQAVHHFIAGTPKTLGGMALAAAGASIFLNEGLFQYCFYAGKRIQSATIIANAWHHRVDGLSSIAVFIGLLAEYFGFIYGDACATAIVVILLLKVAYGFGKSAFDELVESAIAPQELEKLQTVIIQTQGVLSCHQLRARSVGAHVVVDAHVDVDPHISVSEGHHIAELVEHNLKQTNPQVQDVTVHIDPANHTHAPKKAAKAPSRQVLEHTIEEALKTLCPHAVLERTVLHFIKGEPSVDLVFKTSPKKAESVKLVAALTAPNGPFKQVELLHKI